MGPRLSVIHVCGHSPASSTVSPWQKHTRSQQLPTHSQLSTSKLTQAQVCRQRTQLHTREPSCTILEPHTLFTLTRFMKNCIPMHTVPVEKVKCSSKWYTDVLHCLEDLDTCSAEVEAQHSANTLPSKPCGRGSLHAQDMAHTHSTHLRTRALPTVESGL